MKRNPPANTWRYEGDSVQLTERINRIQISPTSAVIAEAEKLKAKGVDIADFGPGEPDFPTPEHIKKAAIRAIEQNFTKYTATGGIMPLREAICAWHKRELHSSYEPKECVVNVGGKHSIFNVVSVLVQQGDQVIIPAPYWVSYPDIVKYAGGTPVHVETRPEDGFSVKASVIEKAITAKTRMVILSSPNNPTGGVVPPDEYERILAVFFILNIRRPRKSTLFLYTSLFRTHGPPARLEARLPV